MPILAKTTLIIAGLLTLAPRALPAQFFLPQEFGTALGKRWNGPSTCIEGAVAAPATLKRGGDPNLLWFNARGGPSDTTVLLGAWSRAMQCVTNVTGKDSAAFVAFAVDSVVTKMIYVFAGTEGRQIIDAWVEQAEQKYGPATRRADGSRVWTLDTLQLAVVPASDFWFGGAQIHISNRRGCAWLQAFLKPKTTPSDTPVKCWT